MAKIVDDSELLKESMAKPDTPSNGSNTVPVKKPIGKATTEADILPAQPKPVVQPAPIKKPIGQATIVSDAETKAQRGPLQRLPIQDQQPLEAKLYEISQNERKKRIEAATLELTRKVAAIKNPDNKNRVYIDDTHYYIADGAENVRYQAYLNVKAANGEADEYGNLNNFVVNHDKRKVYLDDRAKYGEMSKIQDILSKQDDPDYLGPRLSDYLEGNAGRNQTYTEAELSALLQAKVNLGELQADEAKEILDNFAKMEILDVEKGYFTVSQATMERLSTDAVFVNRYNQLLKEGNESEAFRLLYFKAENGALPLIVNAIPLESYFKTPLRYGEVREANQFDPFVAGLQQAWDEGWNALGNLLPNVANTAGNLMAHATKDMFDALGDAMNLPDAPDDVQDKLWFNNWIDATEEYADRQADKRAEMDENYAERWALVSQEGIFGQARVLGGQTGATIGQMLPTIAASTASAALAPLTGGASLLGIGAANVGLSVMFADVASRTYLENINNGVDYRTAALHSTLVASVEVMTEKLFNANRIMGIDFSKTIGTETAEASLKEIAGRVIKAPLYQKFAEFAQDAFEEGAEEYIAEVLGAAIQNVIDYKVLSGKFNPDGMEFVDFMADIYADMDMVANNDQANNSFFMGALVSAVMGSGQIILSKVNVDTLSKMAEPPLMQMADSLLSAAKAKGDIKNYHLGKLFVVYEKEGAPDPVHRFVLSYEDIENGELEEIHKQQSADGYVMQRSGGGEFTADGEIYVGRYMVYPNADGTFKLSTSNGNIVQTATHEIIHAYRKTPLGRALIDRLYAQWQRFDEQQTEKRPNIVVFDEKKQTIGSVKLKHGKANGVEFADLGQTLADAQAQLEQETDETKKPDLQTAVNRVQTLVNEFGARVPLNTEAYAVMSKRAYSPTYAKQTFDETLEEVRADFVGNFAGIRPDLLYKGLMATIENGKDISLMSVQIAKLFGIANYKFGKGVLRGVLKGGIGKTARAVRASNDVSSDAINMLMSIFEHTTMGAKINESASKIYMDAYANLQQERTGSALEPNATAKHGKQVFTNKKVAEIQKTLKTAQNALYTGFGIEVGIDESNRKGFRAADIIKNGQTLKGFDADLLGDGVRVTDKAALKAVLEEAKDAIWRVQQEPSVKALMIQPYIAIYAFDDAYTVSVTVSMPDDVAALIATSNPDLLVFDNDTGKTYKAAERYAFTKNKSEPSPDTESKHQDPDDLYDTETTLRRKGGFIVYDAPNLKVINDGLRQFKENAFSIPSNMNRELVAISKRYDKMEQEGQTNLEQARNRELAAVRQKYKDDIDYFYASQIDDDSKHIGFYCELRNFIINKMPSTMKVGELRAMVSKQRAYEVKYYLEPLFEREGLKDGDTVSKMAVLLEIYRQEPRIETFHNNNYGGYMLGKNPINIIYGAVQPTDDFKQKMFENYGSTSMPSQHFTGEGVTISHILSSEVNDINGKALPILDEHQSDLHQRGRKDGYYDAERMEREKAMVGRYASANIANKYAIINGARANRAFSMESVMTAVDTTFMEHDVVNQLGDLIKGTPSEQTDDWRLWKGKLKTGQKFEMRMAKKGFSTAFPNSLSDMYNFIRNLDFHSHQSAVAKTANPKDPAYRALAMSVATKIADLVIKGSVTLEEAEDLYFERLSDAVESGYYDLSLATNGDMLESEMLGYMLYTEEDAKNLFGIDYEIRQIDVKEAAERVRDLIFDGGRPTESDSELVHTLFKNIEKRKSSQSYDYRLGMQRIDAIKSAIGLAKSTLPTLMRKQVVKAVRYMGGSMLAYDLVYHATAAEQLTEAERKVLLAAYNTIALKMDIPLKNDPYSDTLIPVIIRILNNKIFAEYTIEASSQYGQKLAYEFAQHEIGHSNADWAQLYAKIRDKIKENSNSFRVRISDNEAVRSWDEYESRLFGTSRATARHWEQQIVFDFIDQELESLLRRQMTRYIYSPFDTAMVDVDQLADDFRADNPDEEITSAIRVRNKSYSRPYSQSKNTSVAKKLESEYQPDIQQLAYGSQQDETTANSYGVTMLVDKTATPTPMQTQYYIVSPPNQHQHYSLNYTFFDGSTNTDIYFKDNDARYGFYQVALKKSAAIKSLVISNVDTGEWVATIDFENTGKSNAIMGIEATAWHKSFKDANLIDLMVDERNLISYSQIEPSTTDGYELRNIAVAASFAGTEEFETEIFDVAMGVAKQTLTYKAWENARDNLRRANGVAPLPFMDDGWKANNVWAYVRYAVRKNKRRAYFTMGYKPTFRYTNWESGVLYDKVNVGNIRFKTTELALDKEGGLKSDNNQFRIDLINSASTTLNWVVKKYAELMPNANPEIAKAVATSSAVIGNLPVRYFANVESFIQQLTKNESDTKTLSSSQNSAFAKMMLVMLKEIASVPSEIKPTAVPAELDEQQFEERAKKKATAIAMQAISKAEAEHIAQQKADGVEQPKPLYASKAERSAAITERERIEKEAMLSPTAKRQAIADYYNDQAALATKGALENVGQSLFSSMTLNDVMEMIGVFERSARVEFALRLSGLRGDGQTTDTVVRMTFFDDGRFFTNEDTSLLRLQINNLHLFSQLFYNDNKDLTFDATGGSQEAVIGALNDALDVVERETLEKLGGRKTQVEGIGNVGNIILAESETGVRNFNPFFTTMNRFSGMNHHYDRITVSVAKDIARRFNAETGYAYVTAKDVIDDLNNPQDEKKHIANPTKGISYNAIYPQITMMVNNVFGVFELDTTFDAEYASKKAKKTGEWAAQVLNEKNQDNANGNTLAIKSIELGLANAKIDVPQYNQQGFIAQRTFADEYYTIQNKIRKEQNRPLYLLPSEARSIYKMLVEANAEKSDDPTTAYLKFTKLAKDFLKGDGIFAYVLDRYLEDRSETVKEAIGWRMRAVNQTASHIKVSEFFKSENERIKSLASHTDFKEFIVALAEYMRGYGFPAVEGGMGYLAESSVLGILNNAANQMFNDVVMNQIKKTAGLDVETFIEWAKNPNKIPDVYKKTEEYYKMSDGFAGSWGGSLSMRREVSTESFKDLVKKAKAFPYNDEFVDFLIETIGAMWMNGSPELFDVAQIKAFVNAPSGTGIINKAVDDAEEAFNLAKNAQPYDANLVAAASKTYGTMQVSKDISDYIRGTIQPNMLNYGGFMGTAAMYAKRFNESKPTFGPLFVPYSERSSTNWRIDEESLRQRFDQMARYYAAGLAKSIERSYYDIGYAKKTYTHPLEVSKSSLRLKRVMQLPMKWAEQFYEKSNNDGERYLVSWTPKVGRVNAKYSDVALRDIQNHFRDVIKEIKGEPSYDTTYQYFKKYLNAGTTYTNLTVDQYNQLHRTMVAYDINVLLPMLEQFNEIVSKPIATIPAVSIMGVERDTEVTMPDLLNTLNNVAETEYDLKIRGEENKARKIMASQLKAWEDAGTDPKAIFDAYQKDSVRAFYIDINDAMRERFEAKRKPRQYFGYKVGQDGKPMRNPDGTPVYETRLANELNENDDSADDTYLDEPKLPLLSEDMDRQYYYGDETKFDWKTFVSDLAKMVDKYYDATSVISADDIIGFMETLPSKKYSEKDILAALNRRQDAEAKTERVRAMLDKLKREVEIPNDNPNNPITKKRIESDFDTKTQKERLDKLMETLDGTDDQKLEDVELFEKLEASASDERQFYEWGAREVGMALKSKLKIAKPLKYELEEMADDVRADIETKLNKGDPQNVKYNDFVDAVNALRKEYKNDTYALDALSRYERATKNALFPKEKGVQFDASGHIIKSAPTSMIIQMLEQDHSPLYYDAAVWSKLMNLLRSKHSVTGDEIKAFFEDYLTLSTAYKRNIRSVSGRGFSGYGGYTSIANVDPNIPQVQPVAEKTKKTKYVEIITTYETKDPKAQKTLQNYHTSEIENVLGISRLSINAKVGGEDVTIIEEMQPMITGVALGKNATQEQIDAAVEFADKQRAIYATARRQAALGILTAHNIDVDHNGKVYMVKIAGRNNYTLSTSPIVDERFNPNGSIYHYKQIGDSQNGVTEFVYKALESSGVVDYYETVYDSVDAFVENIQLNTLFIPTQEHLKRYNTLATDPTQPDIDAQRETLLEKRYPFMGGGSFNDIVPNIGEREAAFVPEFYNENTDIYFEEELKNIVISHAKHTQSVPNSKLYSLMPIVHAQRWSVEGKAAVERMVTKATIEITQNGIEIKVDYIGYDKKLVKKSILGTFATLKDLTSATNALKNNEILQEFSPLERKAIVQFIDTYQNRPNDKIIGLIGNKLVINNVRGTTEQYIKVNPNNPYAWPVNYFGAFFKDWKSLQLTLTYGKTALTQVVQRTRDVNDQYSDFEIQDVYNQLSKIPANLLRGGYTSYNHQVYFDTYISKLDDVISNRLSAFGVEMRFVYRGEDLVNRFNSIKTAIMSELSTMGLGAFAGQFDQSTKPHSNNASFASKELMKLDKVKSNSGLVDMLTEFAVFDKEFGNDGKVVTLKEYDDFVIDYIRGHAHGMVFAEITTTQALIASIEKLQPTKMVKPIMFDSGAFSEKTYRLPDGKPLRPKAAPLEALDKINELAGNINGVYTRNPMSGALDPYNGKRYSVQAQMGQVEAILDTAIETNEFAMIPDLPKLQERMTPTNEFHAYDIKVATNVVKTAGYGQNVDQLYAGRKNTDPFAIVMDEWRRTFDVRHPNFTRYLIFKEMQKIDPLEDIVSVPTRGRAGMPSGSAYIAVSKHKLWAVVMPYDGGAVKTLFLLGSTFMSSNSITDPVLQETFRAQETIMTFAASRRYIEAQIEVFVNAAQFYKDANGNWLDADAERKGNALIGTASELNDKLYGTWSPVTTANDGRLYIKGGTVAAFYRPDNEVMLTSTHLKESLKQDIDEMVERSWQTTALNSGKVSGRVYGLVEKEISDGFFRYTPHSDAEALRYAREVLNEGVDKAYQDFESAFRSNQRMNKNHIAIAELLIVEMSRAGSMVQNKTSKVVKLIGDLATLGTELGQGVQALSLINKLTPAGQLMHLKRVTQRMERSYLEAGRKITFDFDPALEDKLLNSTTQAEIHQAVDDIKTSLTKQMPVTWMDKLNAWRYLSMLGNPRTHLRNIAGNILMMPLVAAKNKVAYLIEKLIPVEQRTKAMFADGDLLAFARADYMENREAAMGGGKYDIKTEMEMKRQVFKNPLIEKLRVWNGDLLDFEDMVFSRYHYIHSLASIIKARKWDYKNLTAAQIAEARTYAVREAQKATFRDASQLASALSYLERTNKKYGWFIAATLPFKKTPINILKRVGEYSPIGLINGLSLNAHRLAKGKITVNQFIDSISAGLSGTAVMVIGYFLYTIGWLGLGSGDDDNEREYMFKKSIGLQRYSLIMGDKSYTIDWAAPAAMPLIIGAELARFLENDNSGLSLMNVAPDLLVSVFDPVFELTMLQGITETFQSFSQSGSALAGEALTTMASNYVSQFFPTLFAQIARTVDPYRRSTYAPKDSDINPTVEQILRKIANKVPYLSMLNQPSIDVFGREELNNEGSDFFDRLMLNLFSIGYYSSGTRNRAEDIVLDVYNQVLASDVLPRVAPRSFQINGETRILNNEEYTEFAKTMGKTAYDLVLDFGRGEDYDRYTLDDKVDIYAKIYEYSYQKAKHAVAQAGDTWYAKVEQAIDNRISATDYFKAEIVYNQMVATETKSKEYAFIDALKAFPKLTVDQIKVILELKGYKVSAADYAYIKARKD